jgi:hypothetical protein
MTKLFFERLNLINKYYFFNPWDNILRTSDESAIKGKYLNTGCVAYVISLSRFTLDLLKFTIFNIKSNGMWWIMSPTKNQPLGYSKIFNTTYYNDNSPTLKNN